MVTAVYACSCQEIMWVRCLIIAVFFTYLSNLKGCIDGVHGLKGMDVDVYSVRLTREVGNV